MHSAYHAGERNPSVSPSVSQTLEICKKNIVYAIVKKHETCGNRKSVARMRSNDYLEDC